MEINNYLFKLIFFLLTFALFGEVNFATVDGMKVNVININIKNPSGPIGASAPNKEIDLTAGLSGETIGSISIDEADISANELTFDFENVEIPLKAYATLDGSNYYYTTAAGIGGPDNITAVGTWSDYDYMNVPKIESAPYNTSNRVVIQSYFPEPEFISGDSALVVTGSVDLDFTVLFWDGDTTNLASITPFSYYLDDLYPTGSPAFAVTPPDVVLGINTALTKEVYAFSDTASDLDPENPNCRVISLFFDDTDNLYDGAVKKQTGYNAPVMNTVQRVQASVKNNDGTYDLSFARNFSIEQGEYIFDVFSSNPFTRLANKDDTSGTSTITISGTPFYYKRIE